MGYQNIIINNVPCISCEHGYHQPTPSTVPPLPYKTLDAQRLSITPVGNPAVRDPTHYTSGESNVRDPTNTLVDRSNVFGKGFNQERRLLFVFFSEIWGL